MKRIHQAFIIFIGIIGIFADYNYITSAYAEELPRLYFETENRAAAPGSEIEIKILMDSLIPLNAFDIELNYPSDLISIEEINENNSLITLWQERPIIGNDVIQIKGGSFSPFKGKRGKVLDLRIKLINEGEAVFKFNRADAYIADGRGTSAKIETTLLKLEINKDNPEIKTPATVDAVKPNFKKAEIVYDTLNPNHKLVSFVVEDKESGIKEVLMRTKTLFTWSTWQRIRNPYSIDKDVWAVELIARDNKGNVQQVKIYDPNIISNLTSLVFGILVLVLMILIVKKLRNLKFTNSEMNAKIN